MLCATHKNIVIIIVLILITNIFKILAINIITIKILADNYEK